MNETQEKMDGLCDQKRCSKLNFPKKRRDSKKLFIKLWEILLKVIESVEVLCLKDNKNLVQLQFVDKKIDISWVLIENEPGFTSDHHETSLN